MFGQPLYERENYLHNLAIVEKLKKIAYDHGKKVAQLAVAWVLSHPAVTTALTGIRKPSEIEENVGAAGWHLTPDIKAEIEAAFK
jgi:aryl-alcohol dehydrogenase-like predicted oxidoreductase